MQHQTISLAAAKQGAGDIAVRFLKALDPDGWHNLAYRPRDTRTMVGTTFAPGSWQAIKSWVDEHSGKHNCYFSPNEPRPGSPNKKLTKEDIAAVRVVHVDIDPEGGANEIDDERRRLQQMAVRLQSEELPPTFAIDSGGGVQLFWKLAHKLPSDRDAEQIEAINRGVQKALGGDAAFNVDRLMRLPGTINLPDASKRAKGRQDAPVRFLSDPEVGWHFTGGQIAQHYPPVTIVAAKADRDPEIAELMHGLDMSEVWSATDYQDLPMSLKSKFEKACAASPRLQQLWSGDVEALRTRDGTIDDRSGSAWRFRLAHELHRAPEAFSAVEFGKLLVVWEYATKPGDDIEDKINPRNIARDWVRARPEPRTADDAAKWFDVLEDEPANDNGGQGAATSAKKRFTFISADEAAAAAMSLEARPLVKGLLDQGTASVVFGDSNVGKSFVVLDMAFHISTGRPWAGMKTFKTRVAYLVAEGGSGINRRVLALMNRYGEAGDIHFLIAPINLWNSPLDLKEIVEGIRALGGVGLVVIDTVSRALAGGDENSSEAMGAFVSNMTKIQLATRAHVLGVHHSGKNASRGARGWSGLKAAVDTEIEVTNENGHRTFTSSKQRDLVGQRTWPFELRTVTLGIDEDGDHITSCTVNVVGEPADARPTAVTTLERDILAALIELEARDAGRRHEGYTLKDVRASANSVLSDEDKLSDESVRRHLTNLSKKKFVSKPQNGRYARTALGQKIGTTSFGVPIAQDSLSGGEVVEGGGVGAGMLFQ
jgi:hypothetical protein